MLPFYYSYYQSPKGIIRIKATEVSIYELIFTDEIKDDDLHQPPIIHECKRQLSAYFDGTLKQFNLSINPDGTPFQQMIWETLIQIPYGENTTYLNLAIQSGNSKNTRAIANAIAKNPIAIIIPCHRVIGSNGDLTGYAWGIQRKQWLLDLEAKQSGKFMKLF